MQNESVISQPLIAWGVASRALPGQNVCGDLHLLKAINEGVLMAVVDGLGHGDEATLASKTALAILDKHSDEPLESLVKRCHEALLKTRGAVMTVAKLHSYDGQLSWLGVGNVEGALLRVADQTKSEVECVPLRKAAEPRTIVRLAKAISERVLLRSGIVGFRLPELRVSTQTMLSGDLLVFVTDGISVGFTKDLRRSDSPQQVADQIMGRHFKGTDDALVLVVRYLGQGHE